MAGTISRSRARPTPVALTGSRARTSRARLTGHLLAGLASWVVLACLWVWQVAVHVPTNWLGGVGLIFALLAVWVCLSISWVAWNRSIYHRRHRRTRPIERELDFTHDALGRPIVAPPGPALLGGQVIVSVDADGIKRFRPAPVAAAQARALPATGEQQGEQHAPADGGRPRALRPGLKGRQPV
jgi:hypothetical protein